MVKKKVSKITKCNNNKKNDKSSRLNESLALLLPLHFIFSFIFTKAVKFN